MTRPAAGVIVAALGVALALAEGPADAAGERARLLKLAATDPAEAARLERNLAAFRAMSPERRERLRQLDRAVRSQPPAQQAKLIQLLERYAAWADRLPTAQRLSLRSVPAAERMTQVRGLLDEQFIAQLPRSQRDEIARKPAERVALLSRFHDEDREHQAGIAAARKQAEEQLLQPLGPALTEEFRREVGGHVAEFLRPLLDPDEERRLTNEEKRAEKAVAGRLRAIGYYQTVAELTDRHSLPFPGPWGHRGPKLVRRFADLPTDVSKVVHAGNVTDRQWATVKPHEGRWPDYPLALVKLAKSLDRQIPTDRLGPCRPGDFPPRVQRFIADLPPADRDALREVEGIWPDYPQRIVTVANRRGVPVPGMQLPGSPAVWEAIRRFRVRP